MALPHAFGDWHRCVNRMTKEAKKSTASHYVLYTDKGEEKPSYCLCSAEEEAKQILVESLDNGQIIHRVGETSQLTGPRLFVWNDDLPRNAVWAVCLGDMNIESRGLRYDGCFYCPHNQLRLYAEKPSKKVITSWFIAAVEIFSSSPTELLKDVLAYPSVGFAVMQTEEMKNKRQELFNTVGRWGAVEHRWFGLINLYDITSQFKTGHKPLTYPLHNLLLGDNPYTKQ